MRHYIVRHKYGKISPVSTDDPQEAVRIAEDVNDYVQTEVVITEDGKGQIGTIIPSAMYPGKWVEMLNDLHIGKLYDPQET